MKKYSILIGLFSWLLGCTFSTDSSLDGDSQYQSFAPDGIPFIVADSAWKADGQGNHRAVVKVKEQVPAVLAELPWRRPDMRPETKKVVVVDAGTGQEIKNVHLCSFSSEKGIVAFEPSKGAGVYYIYYLPYKYRKGWNDARYGKPWNDYLAPEYEADQDWVTALAGKEKSIPRAEVLCFESRSRFDSFTSMGCIATLRETDSLRNLHAENPIVFTEDRAFPIRLTDQLPVRWVKKGKESDFKGKAMRNEYYVWQLGIWAAHQEVRNVRLSFSDLMNGDTKISREEITCFNQEGINWDGNPISFTVNVPENKVQALWCGVQIPENAIPGVYKGEITLTVENGPDRQIPIKIEVCKQVLADKGDGDLWRHARLRWLNSKIGEDDLPVAPYSTMQVNGNILSATGKELVLETNGLPQDIRINNYSVLSKPVDFIVETSDGPVSFMAENLSVHKDADGLVSWKASSLQKQIHFDCHAYMEYDGYIRYNLKVSSESGMPVKDIKLVTAYTPYTSEYFMGTGFKGGYRPAVYRWDWTGPWDSYWMGNDKAGLHVEYRGGTYNGPLLNDYKPVPPQTWANGGMGSIRVSGTKGDKAEVIASTGINMLSPEVKNFEFALLITPVKPVNTAKHFSERYYHNNSDGFDKAAEEEPNIANIHHAQKLNPVINYPFIVRDSLIRFVEHEHQFGRKVKLYYTIRELSNYVAEVYALKSLNHEIFVSGPGYGVPWHTEHLIDDYKPAWYTELPSETSDAALVLNGFSRWINYYLEGLRWMFENYRIDGIYMDDVSFDRNVMKRMRKIMAEYRPGALVDLHSNTWYSVGPANQYTDFFPYVDRLWFGESFKYNEMMPDEWFVTFSGIPFGVMSEMLQDGGNRFLGMVYGTTARHSYGKYSPAPVWGLWKSFGIEEARMSGYWDKDCPVHTNHPLVKATAYIKPGKVLISIGNFDTKEHGIRLSIDWKSLNLKPEQVKLEAPAVAEFQKATSFGVDDLIPVKAKEGWLLILSTK